jgi:iron-sulfur cluster assembly accessory protein
MTIHIQVAAIVLSLSMVSNAKSIADDDSIDADQVADADQLSDTSQEQAEVTLTEAAALEIREAIEDGDLPDNTHLRVGVTFDRSNCKGYFYDFGLMRPPSEETHVVMVSQGISLAVEKSDLEFLNGTVIDYLSSDTEVGFKFTNPNEQAIADLVAASQDEPAPNQ